MKKLYILLLSIFFSGILFAQQPILLLTETFENGTTGFDFTSGGVGTNTGTNNWVINNNYSGGGIYPDTPSQDSTVGGATITGAPYSHYLHINDSQAAPANCSWNTNNTSDRFTFIGSSFCTLGMTDVKFTFLWVCEGDTTAYGEVYYKADGGPWTKTGQAKYYNQNKWKYEMLNDVNFNNVQNLQLGFRWVNPPSGVSPNIAFGIDDIIAVGTYDNINHPVTVNVTSVSPTTVCQDDFLLINYSLSAPLCEGTYRIEMSDKFGSFTNPANGGVFSIFAPDTTGAIGFQVPSDSAGTCFRIRINRVSPEPMITGTASICFTIQDCPESIFTSAAPVMSDNDTTCVLSVIDVKFYSFGVFGAGALINTYTAQLSDSTGSFATPYQLGTLVSNTAYGGPPGNVSGLIPGNVPAGCGYYVRVISNHPATIGTTIGPFCLVHCDELTNNHEDLHFCVPLNVQPYPLCDTFSIHPNQWTNQANYDTCNNWTIELHSMMDFSLINSGGLGVYHDSIGGNFELCMPPDKNLLPVPPGAYYMRMVSNCSNQQWNQTGSVIRITIGSPDTIPPQIFLNDTVTCNAGIVPVYVNPFNHPPSDYEWSSNVLNNTNPFIWQYNPLLIDFTNANPQDAYFVVREINFGCYGPYSDRATLTIITTPSVNITGDTVICLGDTVSFNVGYLKETYYNWDAPAGVEIYDEANSQVAMIFDSVGTFTISNFSLNKCGSDSNVHTVYVKTIYNVDLGADKTTCSGTPISLNAQMLPVDKVFTTKDTTVNVGKQGAMFNIIAHSDVVIDSFAVHYLATPQTVDAEIYRKQGTYRTFEQTPAAWSYIGTYSGFTPNPPSQFTVIPAILNSGQGQPITAGDTMAFYITTANFTPVNMQYTNGIGITQGVVYKTDGVIDFVQGTINAYPFGAFIGPRVLDVRIYYTTKAGIKYLWNTGDTAATILSTPVQSGLYSVLVYDTSGCKNFDSLYVTVKPTPQASAGADASLCIGATHQINGSTSVPAIHWTPSTGLSNDTILNPIFDYNHSMEYVLTANDTNGCSKKDTIVITVHPLPVVYAGPDTGLCADIPYNLQATSNADTVLWSPASGIDNPVILNPAFTSSVTVNYVLSVADSFGCRNQDTVLIKVGHPPLLTAGPDTTLCEGVIYVFPSSTDGQNIVWTPSVGLSDSSIISPVFSYYQNAEYIISATDTNGCGKKDTVDITVHPSPQVYAGSDTAFCAGTPYNLQATSNADTLWWSPVTGLNNPAILNPAVTSTVSLNYTLFASNTFGCVSHDDVHISIGRPSILNAGPDTVLCDADAYVFPAVTDGQNILWSPSSGLSDPNVLNPTFTGDSGVYLLIAYDTIGCAATDTVIISRKNCDVYLKVPAAFSPNGDGHNDHFTVFGQNMTEYEIRIFNRWGELVYHSTDLTELNDLSRGWDGTYKGKLQELGTFVYYVHAVDILGKKYDPKGNITLVR